MIEAIAEPVCKTEGPTAADRLANQNWQSNLHALGESQAGIVDLAGEMPGDVEWMFGRDGTLTALIATGRWWAGNSLPGRAAWFMLGTTEVSAAVICFLHPVHAAQLRTVLDRMQNNQALLAIVPDPVALRMILACDDFAPAIAEHRLFIVADESWEMQLDGLLEHHVGLPTPTQFIRPILVDASPADALIPPAQKIFGDHSARRSRQVQTLRDEWKSRGLKRLCVVAPALFRLWDDAGPALQQATEAIGNNSLQVSVFNPDDPASASPVALATLATACDALLMPNTGRGDLHDLLPDQMPLLSWITTPRIPSAGKSGPHDALLLSDPAWIAIAMEQGWKVERLFAAGWPSSPAAEAVTRQSLAIISDTAPLDPPEQVNEYSSHRLLWEGIAHELLEDPFALTGNADNYLAARMRQAKIQNEGFNRIAFLTGVIWNAYQQGIARLLMRQGLPADLFGSGWESLAEFASHSRGSVRSRKQLATIVSSAQALVHVWPTSYAHPIEAIGRPIVRFAGHRDAFLRDARQARAGKLGTGKASTIEPLCAATVVRALAAVSS